MQLRKENILIVDDDVNILELLQRHLQSWNYHVFKAISVKEAVVILRDTNIDLLITDLKMPNLNGYEAFSEIRKFNLTIPIIAQTSYTFENEINKINELGFTDFISKPIEKERLFELIKLYLKRK